jgi:glycerophosphoryl diester phosphodiesterase
MIQIYAHRGNMSQFPENTMEAFQSAINLRCPWIELDIQQTKDGHLVVTHDESSKRVTGVNTIISQTNYEELKQLNFGKYFNKNQMHALPLLSEVFDSINNTQTKVSIQPKANGLIIPAIELAKQCSVFEQIAFNDINCEYLIEAKLYDKNIPVHWDRLPGTGLETDIFIAKQFGFETLMYLNEAITLEKVKRVQNEGIKMGACVVNKMEDFKKYLEWGITHFYTDYPKEFLATI